MAEEEGFTQFLLRSEEWTGKREMTVWGSGKSFPPASGDLPRLSRSNCDRSCAHSCPHPRSLSWEPAHLAACGQAVPLLELGIVLTDIHRRPPGGGVSAPGPSARLPGREF